jgi:hypothetical protein
LRRSRSIFVDEPLNRDRGVNDNPSHDHVPFE